METRELMFVITADIHAHLWPDFNTVDDSGNHSRLREIIECLNRMAVLGLEERCDHYIIAGDLFHDRRSVDLPVLEAVAKSLRFIASNYKSVILVLGNHDLSIRGDQSSSIRAFIDHPNITIVDKPRTLKLSGKRVGFIPWGVGRKHLRTLLQKWGEKHQKLTGIVGHIGIDEAITGPTDFEMPGRIRIKDLLDGVDFDWLIMGHYHSAQIWDPKLTRNRMIAYVGSPLQHNWAETGQTKGCFIVHPNSSYEFIENEISPRFVNVESKADLADVRPQDYVHATDNKLRKRIAKKGASKIEVIEPPKDAIVQTRLKNVANRQQVVARFVEITGTPKGIDQSELTAHGVRILLEDED